MVERRGHCRSDPEAAAHRQRQLHPLHGDRAAGDPAQAAERSARTSASTSASASSIGRLLNNNIIVKGFGAILQPFGGFTDIYESHDAVPGRHRRAVRLLSGADADQATWHGDGCRERSLDGRSHAMARSRRVRARWRFARGAGARCLRAAPLALTRGATLAVACTPSSIARAARSPEQRAAARCARRRRRRTRRAPGASRVTAASSRCTMSRRSIGCTDCHGGNVGINAGSAGAGSAEYRGGAARRARAAAPSRGVGRSEAPRPAQLGQPGAQLHAAEPRVAGVHPLHQSRATCASPSETCGALPHRTRSVTVSSGA